MDHKDIIKKYGAGVLMDAASLLEETPVLIPVSPSIDIALRGGIPEGSMCTLSGKEGSGKSTTALQIAANAQRKEYGSRTIVYDDVEHRLKQSNLMGVKGLNYDPDKFIVIRSAEDKILTAEDHLNILFELIKKIKNGVFILDSSSALCGLSEMSEEIKSDFRNNGPKLLANFCRHVAPILPLNKSILIITNHMIEDTSGKGMGGFKEDSGNKIKHASNIRMRIKYTDKWVAGSGENEQRIGQILHWQILKSNFGPVDKLDSYLRYGYGLDDITETIMLACDIGLITKGGAWFTVQFKDEKPKFQGQEKLYQFFVDNPPIYKELYALVKDSLKE